MTDALIVPHEVDPADASRHWPADAAQDWIVVLGRLCLWFSIVVVSLAFVGVSALAVFALAHHAAPTGGGG
jgi:hypothetical protein